MPSTQSRPITPTRSNSGELNNNSNKAQGGQRPRSFASLTLPKKLQEKFRSNNNDHDEDDDDDDDNNTATTCLMDSSTFNLEEAEGGDSTNGSFSMLVGGLQMEPVDDDAQNNNSKKKTKTKTKTKPLLKKTFGNRSIRHLAPASGGASGTDTNASRGKNNSMTREVSLRALDVFGGSFRLSGGSGSSLNHGSGQMQMHRSFSGGLGRLPPKRDRKCGRGAELGKSISRLLPLPLALDNNNNNNNSNDDDENLTKEEQERGTSSAATTTTTTTRSSLTKMRSFRFSTIDFVQQHDSDTAVQDHYDLGELLGEGAFGSVYLGQCKKQQQQQQAEATAPPQRAIKIIQKGEMLDYEQEEVINEFRILKNMDHPNILKMYEFFEDPTTFCIVTDLSLGGELYDELAQRGNFTEPEVALLMKSVLGCCKYLQEQHSIVHCDLNLENILLESKTNKDLDRIKLIDFGLAEKLPEPEEEESSSDNNNDPPPKLYDLKGKAHYVAPEVLKSDAGYDTKYDIWSAGVMAHICLVGYAPFDDDEEDANIYDQILGEDGKTLPSLQDEEWDDISHVAKDFVRTLLTYNADSRPDATKALEHPFIVHHQQKEAVQFKRRSSTLAMQALGNMRRRGSPGILMKNHADNNNSGGGGGSNKLQEVTCSYIASQLLGQAEKEEVDMVFRAMDTNHDGKLSKQEIQDGYNEYFDNRLDPEELDDLFRRINLSGSGCISYSEFVVAAMEQSDLLLGGNRLRAAFDNFDRDSLGYISHDNLRDALSGIVQDPEAIEKIILQVESSTSNNTNNGADDDDHGRITYDKFKSLMMVGDATTTTAAATATATATSSSSSTTTTTTTEVESTAFQNKPKRRSIFDSDSDESDDSDDDETDSEAEDDTD